METTDKVLMAGGAIALAMLGVLWYSWVETSDRETLVVGRCMVRYQQERNITPRDAWALCEGK